MPGIYVMGVITLIVSTLLWGGVLFYYAGRKKWFLWLLLPGLPLSWAVNTLIKTPLTLWVGQMTGVPLVLNPGAPLWFKLYMALLAPVTEEAIKVVPLLVLPFLWHLMKHRRSALYLGLGLGISFGLGEIIYLAYALGKAPQYASYPWYVFTGFLQERAAVVFLHGALTAIVTSGIARGRWWALAGYLGAIAGHVFVNLGAILIPLQVLSPVAAQLPFLASIIVLFLVFIRLRRSVEPSGEKIQEEIVFERQD